MSNVRVVARAPVLQSAAKSGNAKFRTGRVEEQGGRYYFVKEWWQSGTVHQESVPTEVHGKNEGRANATSAEKQATLHLERFVQKLRDKGYSEDGSADHVRVKPMLAQRYNARVHALAWPVLVQPKLDGFRMLYDGREAWTRGGKLHVRECVAHLTGWKLPPHVIVDGELLLPGNRPLQEVATAAKRYQSGLSDTLEYWVYDIIDPKHPFPNRYYRLRELVRNAPPRVHLVKTRAALDEQEVMNYHSEFTAAGYEGTMIRSRTGGYEVGFRSHGLLKLKDFEDAEFRVVDVKEGKGSNKGLAILVCDTGTGETVDVVPSGGMERRAKLWRKRASLPGRWLTVKYQYRSVKGVPVFPVGLAFRDEED